MSKRTGLGRGIGALIPSAPATVDATDDARQPAAPAKDRPVHVFFPSAKAADGAELAAVPGARLAQLPLDSIVPNHVQPRDNFDEDDLSELEHSIREFGVLQPIVVRPLAGSSDRFELIMGERRWRASRRAGRDSVPALIKDTPDDAMLRDALLENLHRADLNPLEEASAYQQLMSDFSITQDELSKRIGRSRPQISNTIRLLRLPESIQTRVASGVLSAGHARAILSVDGAEAMTRLADRIVNEELSVRAAEHAASVAQARVPRRPQRGGVQRGLDDVAERLTDRLDTRVRVSLGRSKGQIVIDFASVADLNRVLAELGEQPFGDAVSLADQP